MLLLLVLVGFVLSKSGKLPDERTLGGFLLNAALPAMILNSMQVPLSTELIVNMGLTMVGLAVSLACGVAVGFLAGVLARRRVEVCATWAAIVAFPNIIFMGWPFKYAAFGEAALPLIPGAALMFSLGSFTLATWLLSLGGKNRKRISVKKIALQPANIACVVGVAVLFMPFNLPGPALGAIELLAMTTTPVAMVIVGAQLSKCSLRDAFLDGRVYLVAFARLVPAGVATNFLLSLFINDAMIVGFLTIGALMPAATTIPVIAAEQGGDATFCSKVTFVSTVLCIISIPILIPLLI